MQLQIHQTGAAGHCYQLNFDVQLFLLLDAGTPPSHLAEVTTPWWTSEWLISQEGQRYSRAAVGAIHDIECKVSEGTSRNLLARSESLRTCIVASGGEASVHVGSQYEIQPLRLESGADEPLGFLIRHATHGRLAYIPACSAVFDELPAVDYLLISMGCQLRNADETTDSGQRDPENFVAFIKSFIAYPWNIRELLLLPETEEDLANDAFRLALEEALEDVPVTIASNGHIYEWTRTEEAEVQQ